MRSVDVAGTPPSNSHSHEVALPCEASAKLTESPWAMSIDEPSESSSCTTLNPSMSWESPPLPL